MGEFKPDYISKVDAVKTLFKDCTRYIFPVQANMNEEFIKLDVAVERIREIKGADVVEVARAKWEPRDEGIWACTACGSEIYCNEATPKTVGFDFCPCCGAKVNIEIKTKK